MVNIYFLLFIIQIYRQIFYNIWRLFYPAIINFLINIKTRIFNSELWFTYIFIFALNIAFFINILNVYLVLFYFVFN